MDSKYLTMASKLAVGCLVLVDITYKNLDKSGVATASHLASYLGILGVQARRKPPSVDISLTITMFCCIEVQLKKRCNTLEINTKSHELPKDHGVFFGFFSTTVDVQKQPSFALGAQAYDLCSLLLQPTAP